MKIKPLGTNTQSMHGRRDLQAIPITMDSGKITLAPSKTERYEKQNRVDMVILGQDCRYFDIGIDCTRDYLHSTGSKVWGMENL
ncbi:MAG: hypothetical protein ABSE08_02670 [Syntrophobacteraceae bacterium]